MNIGYKIKLFNNIFVLFFAFTIIISSIIFIVFFSLSLSDSILAFGELQILDTTSSFYDDSNYYHIIGEVQNNSSSNSVTNITITASFYDSNDQLLNSYYRESELKTLNPMDVSPFEIIYLDVSTSKNINRYVFNYSSDILNQRLPQNLVISDVSSRPDISGFLYINGKIKNNSSEKANNVMVISSMYDKDGKIIGIAKALAEPFIIQPGKTAAFGMAFTDKDNIHKVKKFIINSFSDEFTSNSFVR